MIPPRKPSGRFTVGKLWEFCGQVVDYLIAITPRQGHGTRVHVSALGSMHSAQPGETTVQGGGEFNYRGMWEPFQDYLKNDVVIARKGQATEGLLNHNYGTFFCVLDHTSGPENQPKEPTINQADTSLDPLESTGPTDIWRTLAQGTWNHFAVTPWPGDLPDTMIPFNSTDLIPGKVDVLSGTPTANANATITGGSVSGSGAGITWSINIADLPPGEIAKFRRIDWCENDEMYYMYGIFTEKKKVAP